MKMEGEDVIKLINVQKQKGNEGGLGIMIYDRMRFGLGINKSLFR